MVTWARGMADPLLKVESLSIRFRGEGPRSFALTELSFEVARGTALALMGPSGSGKSLIASTLAAPIPVDAERIAGDVRFQGQSLFELTLDARTQLSKSDLRYVGQEPGLHPTFTVGEQIAQAAYRQRSARRRATARALELLDRVGLGRGVADLYPHQLGAGAERQVALAIALASQPALIVADEPTESLDALSQSQILDLLSGLKQREGVALLLLTHDTRMVQQLADEVAVLCQGQLVETGPVKTVLTAPLHPLTRELVGPAAPPDANDRHFPGPDTDASEASGCVHAGECRVKRARPEGFERCQRDAPPWSPGDGQRARCYFPGRIA